VIVVDTSIWIAAAKNPPIAAVLRELLDADEVTLAMPVKLELLAGIAKRDRQNFIRRFGALPLLHLTEETWASLPGRIEHAADAGEHFGLADLLIAALATEIGGLVWSLDADFARMERLGLVSLYTPA
jgi:predicted nucleic acid-binding protein